MPTSKDILGQLPGERALDIATGSRGFIHFLLDGFQDATTLIAIGKKDYR
jgi:hypothetical protein